MDSEGKIKCNCNARPTETHFFLKLTGDAFAGDFNFADGCITLDDAPGFGAAIDRKKLEQYAF